MPQSQPPPSHRWFVLATAFICLGVSMGIRLTYPNFFVALIDEFNWSRAMTASVFSISMGITGFTSPFIGILVDRWGARRMIIAGVILASGSMIAASSADRFWQFFLFYGVLATLGQASLGIIPQTVVLAQWFKRNRAIINGIAYAGIGAGVLVLSPLSERLISLFGWRGAYIVVSLLMLGIVLPLTLYGVRSPPPRDLDAEGEAEDVSQTRVPGTPGGGGNEEKVLVEEDIPQRGGWTLRQAMRTIPFWCLFLIFVFMPIGVMGVLAHQVPFIVDVGFTRAVAASILGIVGITSSAGRILFGSVAERIGYVNSASLSFVLTVGGIVALMLLGGTPAPWLLYAHAVLFGVSYGARGPIIASLTANLYPGPHLGAIYGFIAVGFGVGGTVGPWLYGYIHDVTNSYRLAFFIAIASIGVAAFLFWVIKLTYHRFPRAASERFRI